MKLAKLDRSTLDAFGRVVQWGLKQEYEDVLLNELYRTSLQSLIIKLAKAVTRIRKTLTLHLTPAEAFCYSISLHHWNQLQPGTMEYTISLPYFPSLKIN